MARAEFYNGWCIGIMNGTPATFSQRGYYEPIAAATVDELFRLLDETENKLGAKDAYPIFRRVAREHCGFLSVRMAPVIVAVYDKIARFEKNTELRAKLYMEQLMNGSGSAENDAFCMRAIETIAPNFNNLLAAGGPQAALDLLMRVCYDNYSDGYNKYSIGYAEFSGRNGGNGPLTRLNDMNKAAVEKAAELGIELKVGEYSVFRKGAFPNEVRWAG